MTAVDDFYKRFLANPIICTDSRAAKPGSFFLALKGDNFNGNRYAKKALEAGCIGAIVDEVEYALDDRYILVGNSLLFLQDLARYHRDKLNIPVVGLTGTNGKTTTKELIAAVLETRFRINYTQGNFNNHIGVPLTILATQSEHEILVIEMGANHPGEIEFLCSIAQPTHGLITNIGAAHLEGFGSLEGVIGTKTELYRSLTENRGVIFYNSEDPLLVELNRNLTSTPYIRGQLASHKSSHSDHPNANQAINFFLSAITDDLGDSKSHSLTTQLVGAYNLPNVLAALTIGKHFDVEPEEACRAISAYEPGMNRSQFISTEANQVIMDAYNANPVSMNLALDNFAHIGSAKKVLILGQMLELGTHSSEAHDQIAHRATEMQADTYLVGACFAKVAQETGQRFFADVQELKSFLSDHPLSGFLILLKGSRGNRLEELVSVL